MLRYRLMSVAFRLTAVIASLLLFLVLFFVAEFALRVHQSGFSGAVRRLLSSAPFSNIGTGRWMIYDPDLGYRLNPAQPGINNLDIKQEPIAIPKPSGVFRIVFLGDSIPYRWHDFPTFPDQVARMLSGKRKVEAVIGCVPGYTAYQERLFYERYLAVSDPDLVVWCYCLNDNHKFLHRFSPRAGMLWTKEAEEAYANMPGWLRFLRRSLIITSLTDAFAQSHRRRGAFPWENMVDFNTAWKDATWPAYVDCLKDMKRLVEGRGHRLCVLAVPFRPQLRYAHDPEHFDYATKPQRKLRAICERYHVPFLDLYQAFVENGSSQNLFIPDGIHLTKPGHAVAARAVADFLVREKLVPADAGPAR